MTADPLNDAIWIARCVAHMIKLDPKLDPGLAEPLAVDLCSRARWRAMTPEEAAQALFDVGR